jgi:hypothetical protein
MVAPFLVADDLDLSQDSSILIVSGHNAVASTVNAASLCVANPQI